LPKGGDTEGEGSRRGSGDGEVDRARPGGREKDHWENQKFTQVIVWRQTLREKIITYSEADGKAGRSLRVK